MRRLLIVSAVLPAVLLVARSAPAAGQRSGQRSGVTLADLVGTWDGRSMVGPKDSVVATWVLTASADRNGWRLTLPNREPVASRVVAVGGDSVVTETGPYASVLRAGESVTTRTTGHYAGDRMTGTFEARYSSGTVTRGTASAIRRK